MEFEELNLTEELMEGLRAMNFKQCTPVQEKTIPAILKGDDILACAQTGTGKTAAFLLPVIDKITRGGLKEDKINALIMVPTRELAMQIDRQMEGFGYFLNVTSAAIYGGGDGITFAGQQKAMEQGVDIAIATPGRLIALLQMGKIDLSEVSFFILDEADRMLDMGFVDDILKIEKMLPRKRQTLLFSATMPEKIRSFAKKILHNPQEINIAISKPAEQIKQEVYYCTEHEKGKIVRDILTIGEGKEMQKIVVFASKKIKVHEIAQILRQRKETGVIGEMHSDLTQGEREETIRIFTNGKIRVLVATDIVARGIDIQDIEMVINYDAPHDAEDYIHRIGRTARAGKQGIGITLVGENDARRWKMIEGFIGREHLLQKGERHEQLDLEISRNTMRKDGESHRAQRQGRHPHGKKRGTGNHQQNATSQNQQSSQEKGQKRHRYHRRENL